MQIRTSHIARLTINDEVTTSLFVRAYIEEGVHPTEDEIKARVLVAYAKFRKCPLILINSGEQIEPSEYLAKILAREISIESVDAQVEKGVTVSVDWLDPVESHQVWRILRRHTKGEGTIEIRV